MTQGGGRGGERLTARLARALASSGQATPDYGVVVIRLLPSRMGSDHTPREDGGPPDERSRILAALADRVRTHLRADDELLHDPFEGLALLVRAAAPDAAFLVAERLRDALAAPSQAHHRRKRKAGQSGQRNGSTPSGGETESSASRVRVGLGYATATSAAVGEDDATDDDVIRDVIRAAWRPRMLLSVSLSVSLGGSSGGSPALDGVSPTRSQLASVHELRQGEDPESPWAASWATYPLPQGPASDYDPADDLPSQEPEDNATCSDDTPGVRRLRIVPRDGLSAHELETLRRRANYLGVPYMRLPARLDLDACRAVPAALARELRAVPLGRNRFVLTVAMEHPGDANALLRLRAATGLAIFPVLAAASDLDRALAQLE